MCALNPKHPANRAVLASLKASASQKGKKLGPFAPPESVDDPGMNCGSHPDVVDHVWGPLARAVPDGVRCLIYGTPALFDPNSGVILAVCYGTAYCIRVPAGAQVPKKRIVREWMDGETTDLAMEFGPHWIFGDFGPGEPQALREVSAEFAAAE